MTSATRGAALVHSGRLGDALEVLQRALQSAPDDPSTNLVFAQLCVRLQEPELAIEHLQRVLRRLPDSVAARSALAHALAALGRAAEGREIVERVLAADPCRAVAWISLGILAEQLGDDAGAQNAYQCLLAFEPLNSSARYHRAFVRLRAGDFAAGWDDYEQRFASGAVTRPPGGPVRWSGTPVAHLLVVAEQGLGDVLQFARFVPLLQARAQRVTLQVDPTLAPLLARTLDIACCIPQTAPRHDAHIELMSLPHLLGLGADCVAVPAAYLRADPVRVQAMARHLDVAEQGSDAALSAPTLAVGLAWAASTAHSTEATPYSRRSCPGAAFATLLDVPGCRFVSLQIGPQSKQLTQLFDAAPLIRDMDDTAAIVDQLGVVVTVDTSIAHLAGALGKPVLLLLPFSANWQWMHGESTAWYPTVRSFRQQRPGCWDEPLREVAAALADYARRCRNGI